MLFSFIDAWECIFLCASNFQTRPTQRHYQCTQKSISISNHIKSRSSVSNIIIVIIHYTHTTHTTRKCNFPLRWTLFALIPLTGRAETYIALWATTFLAPNWFSDSLLCIITQNPKTEKLWLRVITIEIQIRIKQRWYSQIRQAIYLHTNRARRPMFFYVLFGKSFFLAHRELLTAFVV